MNDANKLLRASEQIGTSKKQIPSGIDVPSEKQFSLPSELPNVLPIQSIEQECSDIKTFYFRYKMNFKPGQFVMVWIPRLDEKPFTISYHNEDSFGISVQEKGRFTKALFAMKPGDKVGFRGPYGNSFKLFDSVSDSAKTIVIGGGCGAAPIAPLIDALSVNKKSAPKVIIGARSKANLIYAKRFPDSTFVTDDGSFGKKAFTTDALNELLQSGFKPDMVYTCGPEIMMKKVVDICIENDIPCQASLERYMKCGFGVCGQCVCGKKRVCIDGPVFEKEELVKISDFGKFTRQKTGEKTPI
ncbi:dihydroorotate dehydrogenase electron transfer subunit [Candidatus Woesearchaeota archaeon]|nr:dihydroorotate dehydrogenase electron transfer subunit [Candidatus Woesearchaeota archaeon]